MTNGARVTHKIISIGEVLWDLLPDGEQLGGAPANFACHAAIQGADVVMLSAVGDDRRGHDALRILSSYGIETGLMQIVSGVPTGTVGIELDSDGKPAFTIHEGTAWDQLAWSEELASRISSADAIVFGTLGQRSETARATIQRALATAEAAGVNRVVDINLRPPFFDVGVIRDSLQSANILKLSDDELAEACAACAVATSDDEEAMIRGLLEFADLDAVVLTRGAQGAMVVTRTETVQQNAVQTNVVDTVGAGDAFTATFLAGFLGNQPHEENLSKACAVAAAACMHSGAVPGLPNDQNET